MPHRKGKLIVLEGVTSTGKDVQAELLVRALGTRAVLEAEPTSKGPFGICARDYIEKKEKIHVHEAIDLAETLFSRRPELKEKIISVLLVMRDKKRVSTLDLQMIFMADRFWHSVIIFAEQLRTGANVICVRYELSTFAYGTMYGVPLDELIVSQDRILGNRYIMPDLTIYIGILPHTAALRLEKSGKVKDMNETEAGIAKALEAYARVIDFGRQHGRFGKIVETDGEPSIKKVHREILSELKKNFGEKFILR